MQQADAPIAARTAPIPSHPGCLNDVSVLLDRDGFFTSLKFIDLFQKYFPLAQFYRIIKLYPALFGTDVSFGKLREPLVRALRF
jgi:hypothetical protein